jgi:amino acid transporter
MLDEPFNGMDPEGIVWMRGFLAALAAEGRAVLVSSHLMSELQETASHLVIIGRGKVIADTSVADLLVSASGDRVTVRSRARWDAMTALANARAEVAPTGPEVLAVSGISAERTVALRQLRAVQRLLPAVAVGRVRRDLRLGRIRPGPGHLLPAKEGRVRESLHAEWTKIRTVASAFWLLLAAATLTVTVSAAASATVRGLRRRPGQDQPDGDLPRPGRRRGPGGDDRQRRVRHRHDPPHPDGDAPQGHRPGRQAAVLTGLTLVAGAIAVLASLIALLSLGAATALREATVAIGAVLGLLYVLPIIAVFDGNATLTRHLEQIAPMTAGMAIQATTGRSSLPISPWAGLGVLAAWAAGALTIGGMLYRSRDA